MREKYTDEQNIQILISLLKKHNIKNIIASPGTTNISLVASAQNDDFFNIYSCVDERSAAYIACGMAAQTGEPVVITCTGATASRNYIPGLTEAFYRKLPVIAVTATQYLGRIGQNVAQVIDRSIQQKDLVKKSMVLDIINTEEDKWNCNLKLNDILLECRRDGGGPVHINMVTTYSNNFECSTLPEERRIERIYFMDKFPEIKTNNVAIFIGNHAYINDELSNYIDEFCEKYNAVVLCDHTSNYYGKYKILGSIICGQSEPNTLKNIDLLIDIGNVSGAYMSIKPKEVWRINPDGELRDTYRRLKYVFEMEEKDFFKKYNELSKNNNEETSYYEKWLNEKNRLIKKFQKTDIPFSNIWIANNIINKIDENSIIHLGILNTLRAWNFFDINKRIPIYCNTGGFGIDGIISAAIGSSLATDKNVYCFIGDLAFFYDLNSIGNREIKGNLRILLVNNGGGTEFHNYNHRAKIVSKLYDMDSSYFAADGHFGNKSKDLVRHYAQDLGFEYISASTKEEFEKNVNRFIATEGNKKPIIFEIFTSSEDESEALKKVNTLDIGTKTVIKTIIGDKNVDRVKKILKR